MKKITEPIPKGNFEWEQHDNKHFAHFNEFQLCVCEPVKEDDTEFIGYVRYYGKTTSAGVIEAKEAIIKLLQDLGKELNEQN